MKHKGVAKNISLRNGGLLITRFSQGRKRNGGCFFLVCRDVRDVDMEEPDKNLQFNNYKQVKTKLGKNLNIWSDS